MKTAHLRLASALILIFALHTPATVLYVDVNSTNPVPPYASWATAAVSIQDGVDAADPGDLVLVTNGLYETGGRLSDGLATNRLAITKALTVQSVNGPAVTVIKGYQIPGTTNGPSAVRCVYLTNDAVLLGFTLTNGATLGTTGATQDKAGGGVHCASVSAIVSNCVLAGNCAVSGGGAWKGSLYNCTLTKNVTSGDGGGAGFSTLSNCVLTANRAQNGGGASYCTASDCSLTANVASGQGGGAAGGTKTLTRCILSGNSAAHGGGVYGGTLIGCVLTDNTATYGGGGAFNTSLNSCTVTRNYTGGSGGGVWGYFSGGVLNNSIIYYNAAGYAPNVNDGDEWTINNCCTTPMPTNGAVSSTITDEPLLVGGSNVRLQPNSPCINAGNNTLVSTATDLDANPRISAGTVDIGAYEVSSPASVLSYAWARTYNLATDGSADYTDLDHDGHNNWQEWMAGTVPTNALSVLKLSTPSRDASGITVWWQSIPGKRYYLQRSMSLGAQPAFTLSISNQVGRAGTNSSFYKDSAANGAGPYFYRIGVE